MKFWFLFLVPIFSGSVLGQKPENVIKAQIIHFNNHDVQALVNNVTDDFVWYGLMGDSVITEANGKVSFHKLMTGYFEAIKGVRSEIENMATVENKVSFKETVYWETEEGQRSQSSLAVYEVKEGKIKRVWYFY